MAVQWLGLHAFTAVDPGSIPGQGTKILGPKKKKKFCDSLGPSKVIKDPHHHNASRCCCQAEAPGRITDPPLSTQGTPVPPGPAGCQKDAYPSGGW